MADADATATTREMNATPFAGIIAAIVIAGILGVHASHVIGEHFFKDASMKVTVGLSLMVLGGLAAAGYFLVPKYGYKDASTSDSTSTDPSPDPSSDPSSDPSTDPSSDPSSDPSTDPSSDPSSDPSTDPSTDPSSDPSTDPSTDPSSDPSTDPSTDPSSDPSSEAPTDDNNSGAASGLSARARRILTLVFSVVGGFTFIAALAYAVYRRARIKRQSSDETNVLEASLEADQADRNHTDALNIQQAAQKQSKETDRVNKSLADQVAKLGKRINKGKQMLSRLQTTLRSKQNEVKTQDAIASNPNASKASRAAATKRMNAALKAIKSLKPKIERKKADIGADEENVRGLRSRMASTASSAANSLRVAGRMVTETAARLRIARQKEAAAMDNLQASADETTDPSSAFADSADASNGDATNRDEALLALRKTISKSTGAFQFTSWSFDAPEDGMDEADTLLGNVNEVLGPIKEQLRAGRYADKSQMGRLAWWQIWWEARKLERLQRKILAKRAIFEKEFRETNSNNNNNRTGKRKATKRFQFPSLPSLPTLFRREAKTVEETYVPRIPLPRGVYTPPGPFNYVPLVVDKLQGLQSGKPRGYDNNGDPIY